MMVQHCVTKLALIIYNNHPVYIFRPREVLVSIFIFWGSSNDRVIQCNICRGTVNLAVYLQYYSVYCKHNGCVCT